MLADTHAHLYFPDFQSDLDEVLQRAKDTGIGLIINIGTDVAKSALAAQQHSDQVEIFSSAGIHPHQAVDYLDDPDKMITEEMVKLEEVIKQYPQKIVAVGECGLDFYFHEPLPTSSEVIMELQRELFRQHINLAKKLHLPLSVHCRNGTTPDSATSAWDETIELVKDTQCVLHCYSGDLRITYKLLDFPYYVSFAANITYPKNEHLREAAKILPLERIVLETDCPFLSPQKSRGQRNEPMRVKEIAESIAQLRGTSFDEVAETTTYNAQKLFNRT